jgi:hypothetical protein
LVRKKKTITFDNLLRLLQDEAGDIGKSELKWSLMRLEIWEQVDVVTEGDSEKIIFKGSE